MDKTAQKWLFINQKRDFHSMTRKPILLFGGTSDERWVSVASAQNFGSHLPKAELWYWDMEDCIHVVSHAELMAHENPFLKDFVPSKDAKKIGKIEASFAALKPQEWVVVLGLHGGRGENGWIQARLEKLGIPFTGSGSSTSEICLDKEKAKKIVKAAGGKVADDFVFDAREPAFTSGLRAFFNKYQHIAVKPVTEGSSRGLYLIHSQKDFEEALPKIMLSKLRYIAEEFIHGRELTIGVTYIDKKVQVLPCSEAILVGANAFDYEGKYLGKGTKEITPAEITDKERVAAQSLVMLAHKALKCTGCTRSEVIFNEKGVYYLETNTLPGLTKASFIPQQITAAGFTMKQFLDGLLEDALSAAPK